MDWKKWFNAREDQLGSLGRPLRKLQEEYRYQAFKTRLIDELKVESPELLNHAALVDVSEE